MSQPCARRGRVMAERWDVMVVDDEPVVREGVRRVLTEAGWQVAMVADAQSAFSHPAIRHCRLILCDLMLPDQSGIEVLRIIRSRRPRLPVVMISGYATTENAIRAQEAGASDFLAKPFEEDELLEMVRRMIGDEGPIAGEKPS